jgi:hypothetical protein
MNVSEVSATESPPNTRLSTCSVPRRRMKFELSVEPIWKRDAFTVMRGAVAA